MYGQLLNILSKVYYIILVKKVFGRNMILLRPFVGVYDHLCSVTTTTTIYGCGPRLIII